jgi:hypothetical protein
MPPLPTPTVICRFCDRKQPDLGTKTWQDESGHGASCIHCGASPLPSFGYPASSINHPRHTLAYRSR